MKREKKKCLGLVLDFGTTKERKEKKMSLVTNLLFQPTARDRECISKAQRAVGPVERVCTHPSCIDRLGQMRDPSSSDRNFCREHVHFVPLRLPHTRPALGECKWLDKCRDIDKCPKVHHLFVPAVVTSQSSSSPSSSSSSPAAAAAASSSSSSSSAMQPSQWLNCNISQLDLDSIGQFDVVLADPPWRIGGMDLSYGLMSDDEIEALDLGRLQSKGGYIFVWVTMRAIPVGRRWLDRMGYTVVSELLWVKPNQLNEPSDRGFTGRWMNHCKEHLLVGLKRVPGQLGAAGSLRQQAPGWTLGLDADVLVAHMRETSRKPSEIYAMIERMAPPGARKAEFFGRQHNVRLGWLTVGNQLAGSHVSDPMLRASLVRVYGPAALDRPLLVGEAGVDDASSSASPDTNAAAASAVYRPGYKPWRHVATTTSDLAQHFINTWHRERPQNFLVPSTLATANPRVGQFRRHLAQAIARAAHPPQFVSLDLKSVLVHSPVPSACPPPDALVAAFQNVRFNCLVIHPPWAEYAATGPGMTSSSWSADEIAALPVTQLLTATGPACVFLWCGSFPQQYEQARFMFARWELEVVEEIAWVQTSHKETSKARSQLQLNQLAELPATGAFQPTYTRCLVGVRNRPKADCMSGPQEMPFVHRCSDVDVLVAEMPDVMTMGQQPDEMYERIERFCMGTRRLELFASRPRRGWVSVGIDPNKAQCERFSPAVYRSAVSERLPYDAQVDLTRPRNDSKRDLAEFANRNNAKRPRQTQ